jgi:putative transposase
MKYSEIPLPNVWPKRVMSSFINAVSLAHFAITYSRSWCADSPIRRVQLAGKLDQARQEIALLNEEIRIKDGRTARIPPHHRPFYPPSERLAIIALKAARGWNLEQTARALLVEPATISSWMKRLDEDGEQSLVKLPTPVNKYPDFVALIVKQLKVLCPLMGKKRIAQILVRIGLQLSASSAGRFLKQKHQPPNHVPTTGLIKYAGHKIIANYPNHVWNIDLTVVPTQGGFWTAWLPFSMPQIWPFCYWVALVMDHFSRRIMGYAVFKYPPSSLQIRSFLARAFHLNDHVPKYIISDKGSQFWNDAFKQWCKRSKIKPRFGAVGRYGSIALIERCIRSMKTEYARQIIVPLKQSDMRYELGLYVTWYNELRPHQSLDGRTPQEIYDGLPELRNQLETRGKNGVKLKVSGSYFKGRKHLPMVSLEKVA